MPYICVVWYCVVEAQFVMSNPYCTISGMYKFDTHMAVCVVQ